LAESQPTLIDSIEVGEITANKITAGTIGAAEITLGGVNSIIKSSTYSPTSGGGWYIDGAGEFSLGGPDGLNYNGSTLTFGKDVQITANLAASSISVGSGLSQLNINDGIGPIVPGSDPPRNVGGMSLGQGLNNYWYGNGNFRVGSSTSYVQWDGTALSVVGNITATSGTFTGTVSGSTITGGSININSGVFTVSSTGLLTSANANITGQVQASSGNIAGINFSAGRLFSGPNGNWANSNTGFYMDVNGYFSLKDRFFWNPETNVATFKGVLDGASGTIGDDFRIGKRLRVGDSATITNSTVMRVQADGNTSTSRYPFVVEKLNGENTFLVREDGRVDIPLNDLFVRNVQVSVNGHGHSSLASVSGDTFTGTMRFNGAVYGQGMFSHTPSSTLRYNLAMSAAGGGDQYRIGTISSSIRYKQDVQKVVFNPDDYFKLKVSTFRWKEHVKDDPNSEYDYGFIAEEARDLGLDKLWFAQEPGVPEAVPYDRVPLILWSIVSQQHETIKVLSAKIEEIESKLG
jgi:hypothetical protein